MAATEETRKDNQMVYRLYHENNETYSYNMEPLNGDLSKVAVIDQSQDEGKKIRLHDRYVGREIDSTYLPSKMQLEGPKRTIADVYDLHGFFVDEKFKVIVESLEPNIHQFFPAEFVWKDGSHACNRYWFFPCNRLDSVDREKTTKEFRNLWIPSSEGVFVFNRSQIGGHHIWIDKFMSSTMGILISQVMKETLEKAGISGMGLTAFEEIG